MTHKAGGFWEESLSDRPRDGQQAVVAPVAARQLQTGGQAVGDEVLHRDRQPARHAEPAARGGLISRRGPGGGPLLGQGDDRVEPGLTRWTRSRNAPGRSRADSSPGRCRDSAAGRPESDREADGTVENRWSAIVFRLAPSAIQHCLLGELGGADPTGPT